MIKETRPLILHNLLKHEKAKYETFHMDLQDAVEDKRINEIILRMRSCELLKFVVFLHFINNDCKNYFNAVSFRRYLYVHL